MSLFFPVKTKKDLHIPFTWAERRPIFLERFFYLPKRYDHQPGVRIDWSSPEIFGNGNEVVLELCSGNGQWIAEQAKTHPEKNWVGVDRDFARARKMWLNVYREPIPNLYVICAEADALISHYVAPDTISQVFINFPDPWPKLRHAKHRLIRAPFLRRLSRIVQNNGYVTLATDSAPYRDQMIRELFRAGSWQPEFEEPFYRTGWASYGSSFFADLWTTKGLEIFYLTYRNVRVD